MRSTLALLLAAPALWAQTGAQVATFRSPVDNSEQPYALFVPRSFDAAKKYPLVVSLHSEDTNHRINLRQVFGLSIRSGETNPEDLRFFPVARDPGFIVAASSFMDVSSIPTSVRAAEAAPAAATSADIVWLSW